MPRVRPTLKSARLPRRLVSVAVQIVAEERRFDIFAELARGLVPSKRNYSNALTLGALPFPVVPRTGHDEIGMLRIAFLGMLEDLPRPPGIFLIPESRNIQIGHA